MLEILKFILSGFWVFVGFVILFEFVLKIIFKMYNRTLRHWTIRKHGYPPEHCDADGDFRPEKEDNEETDDE